MTELSVPNHIAEERKKAREEAARSDVDKAYGKYILLNKGRYISYYKNLLRKLFG